ncbi:MAG TPA: MoaD/ThiS family protein [Planctomycetota bacterium]|nr:MoaD/ThiS family protein [Planctomycetota bacterium]
MQVIVHYHALLREKLGRATEAFDMKEGSVAGDILGEIQRRHGALGNVSLLQVAVNEQIAGKTAAVKDGDRIDVMPPFGGG